MNSTITEIPGLSYFYRLLVNLFYILRLRGRTRVGMDMIDSSTSSSSDGSIEDHEEPASAAAAAAAEPAIPPPVPRHTRTSPSHDNNSLISVFQILIRNGTIHIMSDDNGSDNDSDGSDDVEFSPFASRINSNRYFHPIINQKYTPDLTIMEKNEIKIKMEKRDLDLDRKSIGSTKYKSSFPNLIANRELGNCSRIDTGFSKEHRYKIANQFLPNTCRKIANYGNKVFCGTYSKNGDIFLSASQDRAIRIYDAKNGRFRQMKKIIARDIGWSILDTCFSPDGRHVAYSSWSECIHLCNIYGDSDSQEAYVISPGNHRFCIFSLVFSESGEEILGGGNDGYLYIYNRESNQRVLRIFAHDDDVNTVAFADESSNIVFSGSDDGLLKVWDRRTLNEADSKPVGILAGHQDGITYIDPKGDGRYLISNSKDQSIKLWDIRVFSSEDAVRNTKTTVSSNNWDYRWQAVPKRLCHQRPPTSGDTSVITYRGHSVLHTLIRCHFSPLYSTGQKYIITGCAAGRVVIYDIITGKIVKDLRGHESCVRDVSWHPFSSDIVSSSWDNSIGHWVWEGPSSDSDKDDNTTEIEEKNATSKTDKSGLRRSERIRAKKQRLRQQEVEADDEDEDEW